MSKEEDLIRVHVICWDGVEYDRDADKEEIEEHKKAGRVKYADGKIVFDFLNEPLIEGEEEKNRKM